MDRIVRDFYATERMMVVLMWTFAGIALLITVVSLYTLIAHSVARRRREMGIRLAIGASSSRILFESMSRGLVWVGAGIAAGLLLSVAVAKLLGSMLYGISPLDPLVFIVVPASMVGVAMLASYLPARAATRIDPAECLRSG